MLAVVSGGDAVSDKNIWSLYKERWKYSIFGLQKV